MNAVERAEAREGAMLVKKFFGGWVRLGVD